MGRHRLNGSVNSPDRYVLWRCTIKILQYSGEPFRNQYFQMRWATRYYTHELRDHINQLKCSNKCLNRLAKIHTTSLAVLNLQLSHHSPVSIWSKVMNIFIHKTHILQPRRHTAPKLCIHKMYAQSSFSRPYSHFVLMLNGEEALAPRRTNTLCVYHCTRAAVYTIAACE